MKLKANWSLQINLEMVYVFYFQAPFCVQSVNKHRQIKRESRGLGKTNLYDVIILALCFHNEAPVGCMPTWWDLIEEFVHSGHARFHLQKIFHSSYGIY